MITNINIFIEYLRVVSDELENEEIQLYEEIFDVKK